MQDLTRCCVRECQLLDEERNATDSDDQHVIRVSSVMGAMRMEKRKVADICWGQMYFEITVFARDASSGGKNGSAGGRPELDLQQVQEERSLQLLRKTPPFTLGISYFTFFHHTSNMRCARTSHSPHTTHPTPHTTRNCGPAH
eukprot:1116169-Rhodomonas_salina.1